MATTSWGTYRTLRWLHPNAAQKHAKRSVRLKSNGQTMGRPFVMSFTLDLRGGGRCRMRVRSSGWGRRGSSLTACCRGIVLGIVGLNADESQQCTAQGHEEADQVEEEGFVVCTVD